MSIAELLVNEPKEWLNCRVQTIVVDGFSTLSGGFLSGIETLPAAANTVLGADDSGKTFFVPAQTANNTVTLPPVAPGLQFKFVTTAAPNGTNTLTIGPSVTAKMTGATVGIAAGLKATAFSGKNAVILGATAANAPPGAWASMVSDGSSYYTSTFSAGTADAWTAP